MDNDELKSLAIERYLDGRMTEAETIAFEQQMQADPTLEAALEDERLVRAAMQRQREQDLRAKLKRWRQEVPEAPATEVMLPQKGSAWRFGIGIFAVGLLLWGGYRIISGSTEGKQGTEGQHRVPYRLDSTSQEAIPVASSDEVTPQKGSPKKANDPLPKLLASVQTLIHLDEGYAKPQFKNYRGNVEGDTLSSTIAKKEAITALGEKNFALTLSWIKQADQSDAEVLYIKGHALFGAKRYPEAAKAFRALIDNKRFGIDARWNMVMCYFAQYPDGQEDYLREITLMLQSDSSPSLRKKAEKWKEMVQNTMPDNY